MEKLGAKPNVLIIGAGGVAHVAAHKCAQNNDVLGDICIASRTRAKCDEIIASIRRKKNLKDKKGKLYSRQLDAMKIEETVRLIHSMKSRIVINLGVSYINMSVLEACIRTGASYIDTALSEDPKTVDEKPIWYAYREWKKRAACKKAGVNAILSIGFDPGVVNAYAAYAQKHHFDTIDTIDILDVNAGSHGRYFATNFDPEINLRELQIPSWSWINRKWVKAPIQTIKWVYDFPLVGKQPVYLTGHEEVHSLSQNIKAKSIRFWMGFGDHYMNVFGVLKNLGLLGIEPVKTREGVEVIPLKVVKALLPEPSTLAKKYTGYTCIGNLTKGTKNGKHREIFIYNTCDHAKCYKEVESQAISYTAGVPPVAAAILVAKGIWDPKTMVNVEELDPDPFLKVVGKIGLPTKIVDRTHLSRAKMSTPPKVVAPILAKPVMLRP